jgi:hypothetical protein
MSTPFQRFQQGDIVESLAVREDKSTGELYSNINDIRETFPDASSFRVNGVVLNFLEDVNEKRYEASSNKKKKCERVGSRHVLGLKFST